MKKRIAACLLLLLFGCGGLIVPAAGQPGGQPAAAGDAASPPEAAQAGYTLLVENGRLALYMDLETTAFYVRDKASGAEVHSTPPGLEEDEAANGLEKSRLRSVLTVRLVNTRDSVEEQANSYASCVTQRRFGVAKSTDSVRITYRFEEYGLVIPVDIRLGETSFTASVHTERVEETGDYRLFGFSLLPGLGAGHVQEDGFLLVPEGQGGIIRFADSRPAAPDYTGEIYGRDLNRAVDIRNTYENRVRLPVFGISRKTQGILAVVSAGAGDGTITAAPSLRASSYSTAGCTFTVRNTEFFQLSGGDKSQETVLWEEGVLRKQEYAVTYFPLVPAAGEALSYADMAQAYRGYLLETGGLPDASNDAQAYPLILSMYGAVRRQTHLLGIPVMGTQPLTTFAQAQEMIGQLRDKGVDGVTVLYEYAFQDLVDGALMKKARPVSKIGGKKGLQRLLAFARETPGIEIFPVVDYSQFRDDSLLDSFLNGIKGISGLPAAQNHYDLVTNAKDPAEDGTTYLRADKILERAQGLNASLDALGLTSVGVQGAGTVTYSDMGGTRHRKAETADLYAESLGRLEGKRLFVKDGNAYALAHAAYVTLPAATPGPDIVSQSVPFYSIAVSGLVRYAMPPANLESLPQTAFLKAAETGALAHIAVIGGEPEALQHTELDTLYSCDFARWADIAATQYEQLRALYETTGNHHIVGHRAVAEGVFCTTYENGRRVYVNYTDSPVQAEGTTVEPLSFTAV